MTAKLLKKIYLSARRLGSTFKVSYKRKSGILTLLTRDLEKFHSPGARVLNHRSKLSSMKLVSNKS